MDQYVAAFPDMKLTVHHMIGEGDTLGVFWTATGTQSGNLGDFPASGKSVKFTGNALVRFENGKFAEEWENFDELAMMQQIGAMPATTG